MKLVFFCLVMGLATLGESMAKDKAAYFEAELEGKVFAISTLGTEKLKAVAAAKMVPRGAAVLTPSGELAKQGILHIIHAAPGSMTRSDKAFAPNLTGLKLSISNSLNLAKQRHIKSVALPFVGGGIFLNELKLSKEELAKTIVEAILEEKVGFKVVLVIWGKEDLPAFQRLFADPNRKLPSNLSLVSGSITERSAHGCEAIVNAANMEVTFGGGVSGVIGKATNQSAKINSLVQQFITKYYANTH